MGEGKFETHSLSPLGVRTTEDLGAASQTLLAGGQDDVFHAGYETYRTSPFKGDAG